MTNVSDVLGKLQSALTELYVLTDGPSEACMKSIAHTFASMDDDMQAKFFVEVARLLNEIPDRPLAYANQAYYIGKHLRDCTCSTEEARQFVEGISEAMKRGSNA